MENKRLMLTGARMSVGDRKDQSLQLSSTHTKFFHEREGSVLNNKKQTIMKKILSHFASHGKLQKAYKINVNLGHIPTNTINGTLSLVDPSIKRKKAFSKQTILSPPSHLSTMRAFKEKFTERFNFKDPSAFGRNRNSLPQMNFATTTRTIENRCDDEIPSRTIYSTSKVLICNGNDEVRPFQCSCNCAKEIIAKDAIIKKLNDKINDLIKLNELQSTFKPTELVKDIGRIMKDEELEKDKIIGNYQQAFKYLKFYNIQNGQQGTFIKYLSEIDRLEKENNSLRSQLVDVKKYLQSYSQNSKITEMLTKITGTIKPELEAQNKIVKFIGFTSKGRHRSNSSTHAMQTKQIWEAFNTIIETIEKTIANLEELTSADEFILTLMKLQGQQYSYTNEEAHKIVNGHVSKCKEYIAQGFNELLILLKNEQ